MLEYLGLGLALAHFGIPLSYYAYMKKNYYSKAWNIDRKKDYLPYISIVVPTYNEAELIEKKLEDIYRQEYPRERMEIIVVDSASQDGTAEIAENWAEKHGDVKVRVLRENERRGKAHALNNALKEAEGDIFLMTDADCSWIGSNVLKNVASWLSSQEVGAVSCLKIPESSGKVGVEQGYRQFYNVLRVAESKAFSTPIFHGELAAFKKSLLEDIEGFPTDIGSDDSNTATMLASKGHRAIVPEDIMCREIVPNKGYNSWRIRRAQHLIQHFTRSLKLIPKAPKKFRNILTVETFLHLINQWIFLAAAMILIISAMMGSSIALALLLLGIILLIYKPFRTWIATQLFLILASIRNLWTKEVVWNKVAK